MTDKRLVVNESSGSGAAGFERDMEYHMIKRFKNTPRLAWLVVGACAAAILVPSAAVATGLVYNGIEGTSHNKADVSTDGQLLSSAATPANYYASADVSDVSQTAVPIAAPPSGDGLVVTAINVSAYSVASPGADNVNFYVGTNSSCNFIGPFQHGLIPSGIGDTELTFDPGIVVPNGDALCSDTLGVSAYAEATGYVGTSTQIP
jgi:hypothetical protein